MIYSALDTKKNVGLLSSLLFVTGDDPHDETENGCKCTLISRTRRMCLMCRETGLSAEQWPVYCYTHEKCAVHCVLMCSCSVNLI